VGSVANVTPSIIADSFVGLTGGSRVPPAPPNLFIQLACGRGGGFGLGFSGSGLAALFRGFGRFPVSGFLILRKKELPAAYVDLTVILFVISECMWL